MAAVALPALVGASATGAAASEDLLALAGAGATGAAAAVELLALAGAVAVGAGAGGCWLPPPSPAVTAGGSSAAASLLPPAVTSGGSAAAWSLPAASICIAVYMCNIVIFNKQHVVIFIGCIHVFGWVYNNIL
jgi:hypothetical protein